MTTRTQYLLFLILLVGAICALTFAAKSSAPSEDFDLLIIVTATLFATVVYTLIRGCRAAAADTWRARRGRDVAGERAHEDADGYIHLYELPASMRQRDIGASEILKDMGEASGHPEDAKQPGREGAG